MNANDFDNKDNAEDLDQFATYFIEEEEEIVQIDSEDEDIELTSDNKPAIKWRTNFESKYQVLNLLGQGRFSIVKKVRRITDGKEFAAKFIGRSRQTDKQSEDEYLMMRQTVSDATVKPCSLYLASSKFCILTMELVIGLPLLDWLFARDETSEAVLAEVLTQLIEAVQYLHSTHVAHLDIKPENILIDITNGAGIDQITYRKQLTSEKHSSSQENQAHQNSDSTDMKQDQENKSDPIPRLRLIDYGNARNGNVKKEDIGNDFSTNNSLENIGLGSAEFCAPELLTKHVIDTSADLWSFGILIYVIVSGRSPFLGATHEITCKNVIRGELTYPADVFSRVTQEAIDLTHDLIQMDPTKRLSLQDMKLHPWFNMVECESYLPLRDLASFSHRRKKECSYTLPFTSSNMNGASIQGTKSEV